MTEADDKLTSIDRTLKELLRWTRFANMERLKEILEKELENDQKKLAYDGTDGKNGLREVSEMSGAPTSTISRWWPRWFQRGLVIESEVRQGRMKKIISLEDVGIELPKKKLSETAPVKPSPVEPADQSTRDPSASGGNP